MRGSGCALSESERRRGAHTDGCCDTRTCWYDALVPRGGTGPLGWTALGVLAMLYEFTKAHYLILGINIDIHTTVTIVI